MKGHDEEVVPIRMNELSMAASLAVHEPAEAGHCTQEPSPVDFAGQAGHSHVHRHDLGRKWLGAPAPARLLDRELLQIEPNPFLC